MAKNHSLETNLNFSQLSLEESCPCSHSESNEILSNCKKECVNEHLKNGYQQNQIQQQCEQLLRNQDHETVTQLCNDNKETYCDTDVISYELQTNLHVSEKNSTNFPIFVDNQFQLSENKLEFEDLDSNVVYKGYESENHMPSIMKLITSGLSEPYSIYTYRYFLHNWPHLSFLAWQETLCIGAIVCKLDVHKKAVRRGYIAMLAVDNAFRRLGIGTKLVELAIDAMQKDDCDEIVLETEITNKAALHLYENLGFVRDKRLFRYYLNGVDALRLKLWCK